MLLWQSKLEKYLSSYLSCLELCRLAPVISALIFCHSLSLPVAVANFVSLIPFLSFTTIFSTKGHNWLIHIDCTRLYTFEKKRENDRKEKNLETD